MLNTDLHMKNMAKSWKRSKNGKVVANDSDAGFHFISFLPVNGELWKFDGLERQPQKLGGHR